MLKGFLTYYLIFLGAVFVLIVGLDYGHYQLTKPLIEHREDVKQSIKLLEEYCAKRECEGDIPFDTLSVFREAHIALPRDVTARLKAGELVDMENGQGQHYVYWQLPTSPARFAQIGPLEPESRDSFDLYAVGFYLLIATVLFVAFYPLFKDMHRLKLAAVQFAQHRDILKIRLPDSRYFQPVNSAVTWMTMKIGKLLSLQKELADTLSHELRTNVSRMRFTVAALDDSNVDESRESLEQDLKELETQISEYLHFSKQEHEQPELHFEEVDLPALISHNIKLLGQYTDKQIKFIDGSLSPLIADKRFISRAIKNLIENGIKYCNNTVHIRLEQTGNWHILKIDDDGRGIEKSEATQLLSPYYRGASEKSAAGFGLGLAITQKIIYWHSGELSIDQSNILKGACFTLRLPSQGRELQEHEREER